jgi:hypothetical protein
MGADDREGVRRLGDGDDDEECHDALNPNSRSSTSQLHGDVRVMTCTIGEGQRQQGSDAQGAAEP